MDARGQLLGGGPEGETRCDRCDGRVGAGDRYFFGAHDWYTEGFLCHGCFGEMDKEELMGFCGWASA